MRHLASLAFVVCFLSVPVQEKEEDEERVIRDLIGSLIKDIKEEMEKEEEEGQQTEEEKSYRNEAKSHVPLTSFLGKILVQMSNHYAGPCSDYPHRHQYRLENNNLKETFSTILSILVFVSFHAPSIRQEASLMRCLDSMALVGVDPDAKDPLMGRAAAPGYFWFFSRWIFGWMTWDQDDLVKNEEKEDESSSSSLFVVKNFERAPYYSYRITKRLGLQHVMSDIHQVLDE